MGELRGPRYPAVLLALGLTALVSASSGCASNRAGLEEEGMNNAAYEHEVENLHGFFQDWFNGLLPADEASFARFADAMAPEFVIVSPDGRTLDQQGILEAVRSAHGSRGDAGEVRIWVDNVVVHELTGDEVAVCYEEWHEQDGQRRGRSSRALMRPRPDAPGGVEWVRVDEVWLD